MPFYVISTMCFFILQWDMPLKRLFSFVFSIMGESSTRPKYIRLSTVTSVDMLQGSLCHPASQVECILKFKVLVPIGCHCACKDMLTQFTCAFCKAPEGNLGRFLLVEVRGKLGNHVKNWSLRQAGLREYLRRLGATD